MIKMLTLFAAASLMSCQESTAPVNAAATFRETISALNEKGQFNGAVLVDQGGETLFEAGFGVSDPESGRSFAAETPSRVASVTKQFTAAAIFRLAEMGKLSINDPVTAHLTSFPAETGDRITIRQLLNHSSGLPRPAQSMAHETAETTARDRWTIFATMPLDFEPGTRHAYSNSGYVVLGAIIEAVTGKPYPEALNHLLLSPLELEHTRAAFDHETVAGLASDMVREGDDLIDDDYRLSDRGAPYAAGMLVSNVRDLRAWTRALHHGEIFSDAATYDAMTQVKDWEDNRAFDRWAYASGLFRARRNNGREFIFHDGRLGSYLSDVRYYPAQDLTIVVLETANGDVTATADALEDQAFALLGTKDNR